MIKQAFDCCMERSRESILSYPWESIDAYSKWLAQSYFFVRHSTRLLCLAGYKADFANDSLHKRMGEHFGEENGHDLIALGDLSRLGFDIRSFVELNETKLFYRNQYFGTSNLSPYYLLGYILYLEGVACLIYPEVYNKVKSNYGAKCSIFLKIHVEEDVEHLDSAFSQVKEVKAEDQILILESLKMSEQLYLSMFHSLNQNVSISNTTSKTRIASQSYSLTT